MRELVEGAWPGLMVTQDLGLGMLTWLTHFFPQEEWARVQFAFTNYGVSLGLQAVRRWPARVDRLNEHFETYRSGDEYDEAAITWVMACASRFPGAWLAGFDPVLA